MMKEFNCYNLPKSYINYKYRYELLIGAIKSLAYSVDNDFRSFIKFDAKMVINETFQFDGYVECLFDLNIISESDIEKFWNFTKQVRHDAKDIIFYIDNTI